MQHRAWSPQYGWRTSTKKRSSAFTPASLTALRGWWKSDTGITIATGVSAWADQSGNGNHLLQATGAAQPVVTAAAINGLPAITFDGANDFMNVAFVQGQPETVFCVFRQNTWVNTDFVYDGATDLSRRLVQATTTPGLIASADTNLAQNDGLVLATFGLTTFVVNGATSAFQVNNNAETAGPAGADVGNGITLGCRGSLAAAFSAISVAELIIMGAVATAGERANVRAYVTARYGIAM